MRALRALLILEVILAGAARSTLLASPSRLNPVLITSSTQQLLYQMAEQ